MLSALRLPPQQKHKKGLSSAVSAIISFTLLQADSEQVWIQSKQSEQKRNKLLLKLWRQKGHLNEYR